MSLKMNALLCSYFTVHPTVSTFHLSICFSPHTELHQAQPVTAQPLCAHPE